MIFYYFCTMKRQLLLLILLSLMSVRGIGQTHWIPNPYQFPMNMNVTAVLEINEMEQQNEVLEIGAFCGNECRGSVILHKSNSLDRYYFFLTLYGENNNEFHFRLYDHLTEQELGLTSSNTILFSSNDIIGSVVDPYVFSFTGETCEVMARAEPVEAGVIEGIGTYVCGSFCTLTAVPIDDATFSYWELNGEFFSADPSISFNAVTDIDFMAWFNVPPPVVNHYTITVEASPESGGWVEGGGVFEEGELCVLAAFPKEEFRFVCWMEDGEMIPADDKYEFIVESDRHLVAVFTLITSVDELIPNDMEVVRVCDVQGRLVMESNGKTLDLTTLKPGIYMVFGSDGSVRKMLAR